MSSTSTYLSDQPTRADIDALKGWVLLDFGTNWCAHCQAARMATDGVLASSGLEHRQFEDGPGRPLGRSFRVKLWPTWILMKDGQEVDRLVRPTQSQQAADFLRVCGTQ